MTRASPDFAAIYRAHVAFVWRTVQRFGIPTADAEDAAHEVFLQVRRKLHEFDPERPIRPWLHALTRGVCANRRRSVAARKARDEGYGNPPPHIDPERWVELCRAAATLEAFVTALPDHERELFARVELDGMTVVEAAASVGCNINTAHTRLRAARRRFVAELDARQAATRRRKENRHHGHG